MVQTSPWRCARIILVALALRNLLVNFGVGQFLLWRIEVSTPANALLTAREGLALMQLGVSPYSGSACRLPPLLLTLLSPFAMRSLSYAIPNAIADVIAGLLLRCTMISVVNKAGGMESAALLLGPDGFMAAYLLNPLTVATSVSGSVTSIENLCVVGALVAGVAGNWIMAAFSLACAALIGAHPILLLIPVLVLLVQGPEDIVHPEKDLDCKSEHQGGQGGPDSNSEGAALLVLLLVFWTTVLVVVSDLTMLSFPSNLCLPRISLPLASALGGTENVISDISASGSCWIRQVYSLHLLEDLTPNLGQFWYFFSEVYSLQLLEDLTPNLGQFWYFFSEVFEGYRAFFCLIMLALPALFSVPTALRFPHRPMALLVLQLGTTCLLKTYPSLGDFALYFSLLPLLQLQLGLMQTGMFAINTLAILAVLGPSMWTQWIDVESANSNFFYSITLLLGAWQVMFLLQLTLCTQEVDRLYLKGRPVAECADEYVQIVGSKDGSLIDSDKTQTQETDHSNDARTRLAE
eukprot:gene17829-24211_t